MDISAIDEAVAEASGSDKDDMDVEGSGSRSAEPARPIYEVSLEEDAAVDEVTAAGLDPTLQAVAGALSMPDNPVDEDAPEGSPDQEPLPTLFETDNWNTVGERVMAAERDVPVDEIIDSLNQTATLNEMD